MASAIKINAGRFIPSQVLKRLPAGARANGLRQEMRLNNGGVAIAVTQLVRVGAELVQQTQVRSLPQPKSDVSDFGRSLR